MFNKLVIRMTSIAKFNITPLFLIGIASYYDHRSKFLPFNDIPPDSPEELGEIEYQSRLTMRQAYKDLGMDASEKKLRFIERTDSSYQACTHVSYFFYSGRTILVEKEVYPKNYTINPSKIDEHYKEWYVIGGHEAIHAKDHHRMQMKLFVVYGFNLTYYSLDYIIKHINAYRAVNKFPAVQNIAAFMVTLLSAHFYHASLELSADKKSAMALRTARDLYSCWSVVLDEKAVSKPQEIIAASQRPNNFTFGQPAHSSRRKQFKELVEKQRGASLFFESATYKELKKRHELKYSSREAQHAVSNKK